MRLLEKKATATDARDARPHRRNLFGDSTIAPEPNEAELRFIMQSAEAGDADSLYALSLPLNLSRERDEKLVALRQKAATLDLARLYFPGKGGLGRIPKNAVPDQAGRQQ